MSWMSGLACLLLTGGILWQYAPGVWVLCGVSSSWVARWHHTVAMMGFVLFVGLVAWIELAHPLHATSPTEKR